VGLSVLLTPRFKGVVLGLGKVASSKSATTAGFTGETFLLPFNMKEASEVSGNPVFRSSLSFIGVVFDTPRELEPAHALDFACSACLFVINKKYNSQLSVESALQHRNSFFDRLKCRFASLEFLHSLLVIQTLYCIGYGNFH